MLSRVADSIYWMSRYTERAENIARLIEVNLNLRLDLPPGTDEQWEPLVRATADLPIFREHCGDATKQNVIEFLTFDPDNPKLHPALPSRRPGERPLGQGRHLLGDVGAPQ